MKSSKEINHFAKANSWHIKSDGLSKLFQFRDFKEAIKFVNEIAEISINFNHHPKLINSHANIELYWFTNDENKITKKDIQQAIRSDEIFMKFDTK